ncbi:hypothetical protein TCAL_16050 [Tigriopus californicus]|uniref:Uncharacterized protein n=1 Tax=Tigriopus californicus TaxID=6832 RepID=A0A553PQB7_TIGCA|nr:hypothetical protein TCAL_16050 [Tigriopus californicus]
MCGTKCVRESVESPEKFIYQDPRKGVWILRFGSEDPTMPKTTQDQVRTHSQTRTSTIPMSTYNEKVFA